MVRAAARGTSFGSRPTRRLSRSTAKHTPPRRRAGGKTGLQQITAGRRFPVQHLAGDKDAGTAPEHEVIVDLVEGDAACGGDRGFDRCRGREAYGTALISAARAGALKAPSFCDDAAAASCNRPIAAGESFAALRSTLDNDCLPRGASSRCCSPAEETSGRSATVRTASPLSAIASRSGADSA